MKQIFFLVALFAAVFALNAGAQEKPGGPFMGKVKGTVKDESARIIETATITLIRNTDSTVVKMSVADRSGHYTIELIPAGTYMVMISAVGHQTAFSGPFEISQANPEVDVKAIELLPAVKTETGVTVVARRPLIEQKTDRTIVNVEAAVTNVGKSALEVLEKSPGITVDKDGNISLKGKSGVMVMIDGRPSYLSGQDLANMLRSMTASQLDQIEIMTNPPAKYDAAGNAGVINIKTKKNKQFGYSGSITTGYTQAFFPRFNEAASFNYRNGKINFFSNLSYNRNHRRESLSIYRNFRTAGTKEITSIFDQVSNMQNRSHYYSAKLGMDYTASKKTTIGFVLNGYYNPSTWESITNTDIFDPNKVLLSKTGAYSENKEKWKNFSGNINLTTVFDTTGQELSANVDYVQYRSSSTQPLISSYYNTSGQLTQTPDTLMGNLPQDITIYSAKADYTKPLKNGAKFEAGFKTSYVKNR
ncbi:MAG: outer membrane beta-barrel protein [Chitinophagaceae bacterium]|nr:outer membrane beta-barrel protein [Chitinophagaceae bacterium]